MNKLKFVIKNNNSITEPQSNRLKELNYNYERQINLIYKNGFKKTITKETKIREKKLSLDSRCRLQRNITYKKRYQNVSLISDKKEDYKIDLNYLKSKFSDLHYIKNYDQLNKLHNAKDYYNKSLYYYLNKNNKLKNNKYYYRKLIDDIKLKIEKDTLYYIIIKNIDIIGLFTINITSSNNKKYEIYITTNGELPSIDNYNYRIINKPSISFNVNIKMKIIILITSKHNSDILYLKLRVKNNKIESKSLNNSISFINTIRDKYFTKKELNKISIERINSYKPNITTYIKFNSNKNAESFINKMKKYKNNRINLFNNKITLKKFNIDKVKIEHSLKKYIKVIYNNKIFEDKQIRFYYKIIYCFIFLNYIKSKLIFNRNKYLNKKESIMIISYVIIKYKNKISEKGTNIINRIRLDCYNTIKLNIIYTSYTIAKLKNIIIYFFTIIKNIFILKVKIYNAILYTDSAKNSLKRALRLIKILNYKTFLVFNLKFELIFKKLNYNYKYKLRIRLYNKFIKNKKIIFKHNITYIISLLTIDKKINIMKELNKKENLENDTEIFLLEEYKYLTLTKSISKIIV